MGDSIFTEQHYEIFQLISQNKFNEALYLVLEIEKLCTLDELLSMIKVFLYIELNEYSEAEKIFVAPIETKFDYFLKVITKSLNKMAEYCSLVFETKEEQYDAAILSGNYALAKNVGIQMMDKNIIYAVFSLIMSYKESKSESDLRLLKLALQKCIPYPNIYNLLAKYDIAVDVVMEKINLIDPKNLLYLYTLKTIYINHEEYRGQIDIFLAEYSSNNSSMKNSLDVFIENFDDWIIYEMCVSFDIVPKERNTLNHKMYLLNKTKDLILASQLLTNIDSYDRISKVASIVSLDSPVEQNTILFMQLSNEYCEENLKKVYSIYTENKSQKNLKILLAYLIASKKEANLILALFLAKRDMDIGDDYSIRLIYTFLCRFFCMYTAVQSSLTSLRIRTIQHENLVFVWNDINLKIGISDDTQEKAFINLHYKTLRRFNDVIYMFITAGKIDQAEDALSLRKKLTDSKLFEEVHDRKIVCNSEETMFSNYLGPSCKYIFSKLTVDNSKNNSLGIFNLFGINASIKKAKEFLKNEFMDLSENIDFIDWLDISIVR